MNEVTVDEVDHHGDAGALPLVLSSFIGRACLLEQVRARLGSGRQVTLTGVGGVGKTRLAIELAESVQRAFDDVRWVELARIQDPDLLMGVVAGAVGLSDQAAVDPLASLMAHLRDRRVLLVLDNCEHLRDAVGVLVATLLRGAPRLHVLATSRESLYVPDEQTINVPPLELPPSADVPIDGDYEAVALFNDLVEARISDWSITADAWPSVVKLLHWTAGIPLAIKLAVARLRSMSIEDLVARLDDVRHEAPGSDPAAAFPAESRRRWPSARGDGMQLLTRNDQTVLPHHATLEAVIRWSYDLCSPCERLLWAHASVFRGGFTLAAAEAVCTAAELPVDAVADAVSGLVEKSVLVASPDRSRYELLEPLRTFGHARLRDTEHEVVIRHRDYYSMLAASAAESWLGPTEVRILRQITADMPNYRAAMTQALTEPGTAHIALQIAVDLGRARWFFFHGTLPEGRRWLQRALETMPEQPDPLYTAALAMDAWLATCQGSEEAEVRRQLDEAAALAERCPVPVPAVTFAYGGVTHFAGDARSIGMLRQVTQDIEALGPAFRGDAHMARMLATLGMALLGEPGPAVTAADDFLVEAQETGAPWAISWAIWGVGVAELRGGNLHRAVELLERCVSMQRAMDDRWGVQWSIEAWAWALAARLQASQPSVGDRAAGATELARQVARLLGAAHGVQLMTNIRISRLQPHARFHDAAVRMARSFLSDEDYQACFDLGARAQTVDEAMRLVSNESPHAGDQVAPAWQVLTPKQAEVARLVATGLTNRQIAEQLVVGTRTVESHVQAIYRSIGFKRGSRTQLTSWVRDHDPRGADGRPGRYR